MDEIVAKIRAELRTIETGHAKQGQRLKRMRADHAAQGEALAALHQTMADAVAQHGCDAGVSPDLVANITGPKTPPSDD